VPARILQQRFVLRSIIARRAGRNRKTTERDMSVRMDIVGVLLPAKWEHPLGRALTPRCRVIVAPAGHAVYAAAGVPAARAARKKRDS
jgi:hypothetical protein